MPFGHLSLAVSDVCCHSGSWGTARKWKVVVAESAHHAEGGNTSCSSGVMQRGGGKEEEFELLYHGCKCNGRTRARSKSGQSSR